MLKLELLYYWYILNHERNENNSSCIISHIHICNINKQLAGKKQTHKKYGTTCIKSQKHKKNVSSWRTLSSDVLTGILLLGQHRPLKHAYLFSSHNLVVAQKHRPITESWSHPCCWPYCDTAENGLVPGWLSPVRRQKALNTKCPSVQGTEQRLLDGVKIYSQVLKSSSLKYPFAKSLYKYLTDSQSLYIVYIFDSGRKCVTSHSKSFTGVLQTSSSSSLCSSFCWVTFLCLCPFGSRPPFRWAPSGSGGVWDSLACGREALVASELRSSCKRLSFLGLGDASSLELLWEWDLLLFALPLERAPFLLLGVTWPYEKQRLATFNIMLSK